jgi:hypothetical protein
MQFSLILSLYLQERDGGPVDRTSVSNNQGGMENMQQEKRYQQPDLPKRGAMFAYHDSPSTMAAHADLNHIMDSLVRKSS